MRRGGGKNRQKGPQRGIQHPHNTSSSDSISTRKYFKLIKHYLQLCAEKFFCSCLDLGSFLSLFPAERTTAGYRKLSLWRRALMYVFYITVIISAIHKIWACYTRVAELGTIDISTFACFMIFLFQLNALNLGLGSALQADLTTQLLNSYPQVLAKVNVDGKPLSAFSLMEVAIPSLGSGLGTFIGNIGVQIFLHFYFERLPILPLPILEQTGLLQHSVAPRWIWTVLLLPIDLHQSFLTFVSFIVTSQMLMMGIGTFKLATEEIRKQLNSRLQSRQHAEHLYMILQVHAKLCEKWLLPVMVPMLFTLGASVVFLLCFPLKHTELPVMMKLGFAFLAMMIMFVLMVASVDMAMTIKASEDLVEQLRSGDQLPNYLFPLERKRFLKTAKAMRPISLPLGTFGSFSLDVPIIIWDEVINQLLFLLSF